MDNTACVRIAGFAYEEADYPCLNDGQVGGKQGKSGHHLPPVLAGVEETTSAGNLRLHAAGCRFPEEEVNCCFNPLRGEARGGRGACFFNCGR